MTKLLQYIFEKRSWPSFSFNGYKFIKIMNLNLLTSSVSLCEGLLHLTCQGQDMSITLNSQLHCWYLSSAKYGAFWQDWKVTKFGRSFPHGWLMMLLVVYKNQILQGKRLLIPRRWFFCMGKVCSLGVAWSVALCAHAEDKEPWFWAALAWLSPRELPTLLFLAGWWCWHYIPY